MEGNVLYAVDIHVTIKNLEMLVFEERGKSEYPEKNLSGQRRERTTNCQTQPTDDARSVNRTRDTLVGGELSHHCAIPAPKIRTPRANCYDFRYKRMPHENEGMC